MIRDTSLCGLGSSAPNPLLTTMRHFRHEFEDHIRAKRCRAGVCEDLALSPCENSCPLHMNIPRFLQLYQEGRLEDAFEAVVLDNPLPASTGRVCQHPCDNRCRRSSIDEPVNMREVHRFIADSIYQSDRFDAMVERIVARKLPPTGPQGRGGGRRPHRPHRARSTWRCSATRSPSTNRTPSRAACCATRCRNTACRAKPCAREVELIRRLGVNFVFDVAVGTDITLNDLDNQYDAVFLAIGTWKESWVYLPGTELNGVMPALLFLEAVAKEEPVRLGRKVVVIGGGNAAIDSARTALRMGADVTVIYRRERKDMPAIPEETEAAEAEGAKFVFLATPHRIVGDADGNVKSIEVVKTRLGEFDSSGRRRPVPTDEIRRIDCDTVILAVGEAVDLDFVRASGLRIKENGHARSGPLHARNQPQQILRRRRPDHRRLQRLERHGLRQEGGPQHRPAADGRRALGPDRRPHRVRPEGRPTQPSESRAPRDSELPALERVESFLRSHGRAIRRKRRSTRPAAACAATSRTTIRKPCQKKSQSGSTANMSPPRRARPFWRWPAPTGSTSPRSAGWTA